MKKKILIVDDNNDIRILLSHELSAQGYQVLMASTGAEAIAHCTKEKPDLILMDISMPDKDGPEAATDIKANPATQDIPVIFLTALIHQGEIETGGETTDRIILSKATPVAELVRIIEQALE